MTRRTVWLAALLLVPSAALAVSTRSFVIDTSDAFEKGTPKGTAVHTSGKLTGAVSTERVGLEGVPVATASAVGRDGAIYVATGNDGAIHRVTEQGAKLFADTDAALVTSLLWVNGTLYAGTLPGGRIFAISSDGKVKEHAKLAGADHVWALAYADKSRTLYAATGPEGKLFALDAQGRAQVAYDDEAEHLLALGIDAQGRVLAGTSNGARLVRIDGKRAEVLYDFPGQELSVLQVGPSFVAVASNDFPAPPPASGDTKDLGAALRAKRIKPGKGAVYVVSADGKVEQLHRFDDTHVSALEIDSASEAVHAGLGQEGRIVRLSRSGERALWADVDERQIVALHLTGPSAHFVSSDGAAVYRVRPPKTEGEWTSAVLDAKAPARFGELRFRARGALKLATRSGNTETPGDSWSPWSAELSGPGPIKSPPARFLQIRVTLSSDAELYAVEAFYLPQNLPAYVRNVRPKNRGSSDPSKPPSTILPLTWEVDNQDDDKLRYRLFVRREGQTSWLPLLREHELLEQPDYAWETRSVPDGHYRVRVVAADDADNPEPYVTSTESISAPVLVDNRAPELSALRFEGGKLSGRARDATGPITSLELSIDSAPYRPFYPSDDLLDTGDEQFQIGIAGLAPGTHTLAVRASDAARNLTTAALEVTVSGR